MPDSTRTALIAETADGMTTTTSRLLPVSARFGFPLGLALGVLGTLLSVAIGATGQPTLSLIVMVAVVDTVAMLTTVRATLATIVVCWCLHAGFVLGRQGELALTRQSGHDALVLLVDTLFAWGFASTIRAVRTQDEKAISGIPSQRQGDSFTPSIRS
jgi:hypothetical protein